MKRACVVDVYTSTYWYVPVCTSMYLRYLNFEFFEIRPHPSISLALELYAVAVYVRRAALVYEKHSCLQVVNCIYLYVPVCTLPMYVLVRTFRVFCMTVHTGTYCVCTKIMSCMLDNNRGTIQYWITTAYMSRTHSIISHRHPTQNSINCNIFVNAVQTSMYLVRTLVN
jgi:hypothetical protein